MRLGSAKAALLLMGGLAGCTGHQAGKAKLVYVGPDRVPHEAFTWFGPIGSVYDKQGNDPRVGRVGPGQICETRRIVSRPDYDETITEDGEPMHPGLFARTLFSECLEPGKELS